MKGIHFITRHSFPLFLLVYHLLFTLLTWHYFREKGGDAAYYWFETKAGQNKTVSDLFTYGSDSVLLLNSFFVKVLHLEIQWGFLLYSCVGFFGIMQFYALGKCMIKAPPKFFGFDILCLLLLLPNLHFWTATLGKESLCFLFIATVLLEIYRKRFLSFSFLASAVLLAIIRPHIAFLLFSAIAIVFLFDATLKPKQKLVFFFCALLLLSGLFYMFLQLSEIHYFDWQRIRKFNAYSLLSFRNSGSYVPMIDYSYPYKIFTFYFRPFPHEISSFYGLVLGIENVVVLLLHVSGVVWFVRNRSNITFHPVSKMIFVFTVISGIIIVQRYSGFGIFARTKIMIQPFMCLVLLWILTFRKSNHLNA